MIQEQVSLSGLLSSRNGRNLLVISPIECVGLKLSVSSPSCKNICEVCNWFGNRGPSSPGLAVFRFERLCSADSERPLLSHEATEAASLGRKDCAASLLQKQHVCWAWPGGSVCVLGCTFYSP